MIRQTVPHRATALFLLLADWSMFGIMVASAALLGPCTAIMALIAGIPTVFLMERTIGGRTTKDSALLAVVHCGLLCVPLPITGTLAMVAALLMPYDPTHDEATEAPTETYS